MQAVWWQVKPGKDEAPDALGFLNALFKGQLPGKLDLPDGHVQQILLISVGCAAGGGSRPSQTWLLGPGAR